MIFRPWMLCVCVCTAALLLLACTATPLAAKKEDRSETQARQRAEAEQKRVEAERRKAEADARARRERVSVSPVAILIFLALTFTFFYLGVMGAMCLTGLVLAHFTRVVGTADLLGKTELTGGGQVARTQHESLLALVYALALTAALVLFYLSLPWVFGGLLLVFVLFLFVGRNDGSRTSVKASMLRASSGGMSAVLQALFARAGGTYGLRKERGDCPRLYQALDEVAQRVDTEPVDEVYLSPGADFGVHQEGRGPFGVFGGRKRVLTLGLCVLHFLTISELKAILAHEYAHFSHADTFWNRFLFQVTLSLRTALRQMAETGGWVTTINPFYWFFWLYSQSYRLLAAGFSRSREFLADRMACSLYGSDAFTRSLAKVCTDGTLFEMTIYRQIRELLRHKKAYVNMYLAFRKFRDEQLSSVERASLYQQLLDDKPSLFASHPTFAERVEAARGLPYAQETESASALQLFEDPETIERELTDFLTEVVSERA